MLLVLTWAAGVIDAVSYLGLGRVFTAMMTGNTVLLALAIGQGEPAAVLRSALALIGFSAGAASGALIGARDPSRGEWPAVVTGALAVEAVILGAFAIVWQVTELARTAATTYLLIGLSGLAMGVQSAAVRRLGVPGVATTYITGTLTTLMADLTGRILFSHALARGADHRTTRRRVRGLRVRRVDRQPSPVTVTDGGHVAALDRGRGRRPRGLGHQRAEPSAEPSPLKGQGRAVVRRRRALDLVTLR